MKLYTNPASPFCRKIEVLLHEARCVDLVDTEAAGGTPVEPGTLPITINPIGKIPTLVLDDGRAFYDSRVIARFLDDKCASNLYLDAALWDVLTLEATGDGISDAAVLMVYEGRVRPEDIQYAPYVESQWAKVTRALDHLENQSMTLLDGPLTIGHIAVGCALGYLDFRHGARDWRVSRPALAAWYDTFAKRPSMQATQPPPA